MSKYTLSWDKLTPIGVKTEPDGSVVRVYNECDVQRKYGRELMKWLVRTNPEHLVEGPSAADDWSDDGR